MNSTSWLGAIVSLALVATAPSVRADYVAGDDEIAAMKTKILKNPPTATTLTAPPYPGSKLDADCSADQSASNQPQTMVYCLYSMDPIEKVKEYLAGPGKPAPGVTAYVDRADVAENGYVKVHDVTQVRYYVSAKKPAPAAAPASTASSGAATPATAPASPPAQPSSTTAAAPAAQAAPPAPAPAADKEDETDGAQAVQDAVSTVKKLKGLFGGG